MIVLGISEGFHNAAVCYLKDNIILHASESERFSKIKNDKYIHPKQINLYKKKRTKSVQANVSHFNKKKNDFTGLLLIVKSRSVSRRREQA